MNIVVTGSSRGIGLAIAKAFSQQGHHVLICSRNAEKLNQAKHSLASLSDADVHAVTCDMSVKSEVEALAQRALEVFPKIDILVNNAGSYVPGAVHDEDKENLNFMLKTNLESAYHLTRAILPSMKANKSGQIINITSIAGIEAYANSGSYSISKFAMEGFSRNLREEMKEFGIKVTSIRPGAVLTDAWAAYDGPKERLMPVEDIADICYAISQLSNRTVVEDIVLRPQLGDL